VSVARVVAESVPGLAQSRTGTAPGPTAPRGAVGLGRVLVPVGLVAAAATLWWPDLLTGTAVMNGSARGTALVVLVLAVPLLALALRGRGPHTTWTWASALGATAYLLYNAVLFAFATPFNHVFLVYVAMLGLAFWTLVLLLAAAGSPPVGPSRVHRLAASWIGVVVVLNTLAWLGGIVPAVVGSRPTSVLDGTGLTTNPVYVQDLAIWLPALAWVAWQLWHGRHTLLAAGALLFWTLEGVGVAVDQAWGYHADPTSIVASAAVVPMFAVVVAVTATVLVALVRESR
jgi:hypothetical protein